MSERISTSASWPGSLVSFSMPWKKLNRNVLIWNEKPVNAHQPPIACFGYTSFHRFMNCSSSLPESCLCFNDIYLLIRIKLLHDFYSLVLASGSNNIKFSNSL